MANALYGLTREVFLGAGTRVDWDADDIRLILVDNTDYTVSIDTHDFLDDVAAAGRVATSGSFTGKTTTLGVADADNVTCTAVSGDSVESIVIYKHTGTESTSNLIAYIDTATGLPFTPSGGDVTISWDNGANRIFKL